jgi:GlpG protein
MSEIKALEAAIEQDLRALSVYLWRSGVPHRIAEDAGLQVVWVGNAQHAELVRELYERLQRGEPLPALMRRDHSHMPRPAVPVRSVPLARTPVTLSLIALSIVGFYIGTLDPRLESLLTFFEFDQLGSFIFFKVAEGEYWRLLTPIFLHFSLLHIVFNMLWLWDLGRRVELRQGPWQLLLIVVLIGVGSNIAQAAFAGPNIFGGMSGVDYGLLGYCWLWGWVRKDPVLHVPKAVMIAMVAIMLLSMTGITEFMGGPAVANAAHVGGLVMGLLLGAYVMLLTRTGNR